MAESDLAVVDELVSDTKLKIEQVRILCIENIKRMVVNFSKCSILLI
jgi:hypothetical protein